MTSSQPGWYVVQTQPNAESKAVAHLGRQGFATYLPRYLKRRRHARRIDVVTAPLFPRYLFVEIDMAIQRWRSIYSTIGVSRLVCTGDVPTPVPGHVVAMLKDREDAAGFIQLDRQPLFRVGDKIRVLEGLIQRLPWTLRRHAGPRPRRGAARSARTQGSRAAGRRGRGRSLVRCGAISLEVCLGRGSPGLR